MKGTDWPTLRSREVDMKFELDTYHRDTPDEDLIQDVRDVAKKLGIDTVTISCYDEYGKYHPKTLWNRFGSWFEVLRMAGLKESRSRPNVSENELFDNLRNVWIALGRQPASTELTKPLSKYSVNTYGRRFGGWRKALEAFVQYVNQGSEEELDSATDRDEPSNSDDAKPSKRRTKREISERLRFRILLRDGFRCQSCGRSPVQSPGVELHVDHVVPWSKGGETTLENLQTKCSKCNLGKGNAFDK